MITILLVIQRFYEENYVIIICFPETNTDTNIGKNNKIKIFSAICFLLSPRYNASLHLNYKTHINSSFEAV